MTQTDLAQAALDALQSCNEALPAPQNLAHANRLRAKIAGVAMRKCRLANEGATADWAAATQVEEGRIEAWEHGESAPSLPELELLASCQRGAAIPDNQDGYMLLRQRMIGVSLRMARREADISLDELAAKIGMSREILEACEYGDRGATLPELAAIAQAIHADLSGFLEPTADMASPARLADGSADAWRDFATDSENAAFIRLAMAFRHIDADHLHRIADALFAIIRANEADAAS